MAWSSGETINSLLRMQRLSGAIPTSYSILKIGSTYYAECNITGGTEYSGTDAATVIQNAYDAMQTGEALILKGNETYDIGSTTLLFDDLGKQVIGEAGYYTIISYSGTGTAIQVGRDDAVKAYSVMRNFRISSSTAAIGLKVYQRHGVFENIWVEGLSSGIAVQLDSYTGASFYYNDFYSLFIKNCLNGVYIAGNSTKQVNGCRFFGGAWDGTSGGADGSYGMKIDYGETNLLFGVPIDNFDTGLTLPTGKGNDKNIFVCPRFENMTTADVNIGSGVSQTVLIAPFMTGTYTDNGTDTLLVDRQRGMRSSVGVSTLVKAGAVVDGDFVNPENGLIAIDSSNGRIYFRYGGAWHYVNQTA